MSQSIKLTDRDIFASVRSEVQLWRNLQIGAIRSFDSNNLPYLKELPGIFQAAAWFGLGMDAVGKLAPNSGISKVATKATVPLALLDYTTKYFANSYAKAAEENRVKLSGNMEVYKTKLIDGITDAERMFYTDDLYGRPLMKLLSDLTRNDSFSRVSDGDRLVRQVIKDSSAVDTTAKNINEQTKSALESVAKVVKQIFMSSKYSNLSGCHHIKKSNEQGPFSGDEFKLSSNHIPINLLITMKPGDRINYMQADGMRIPMGTLGHPVGDKFTLMNNDTELNHILLNAWRYNSNFEENYLQCDTTWIWKRTRAIDSTYLARSFEGSFAEIKNKYQELRAQYIST